MATIKQHVPTAIATCLIGFTFAATGAAVALGSEAWTLVAMASAIPLAVALLPRPASWRRAWTRLQRHHALPRRVQRESAQHAGG